jgi:nicotinate-nucleotide adenylyltransferase
VSSRKRIAIYGGAFDPIHNGHLATIGLLLASGQVDSVVVVPSGDRPDKKTNACAADRLVMTKLALEEAFPNEPRVVISDIHATGKVGYGTIDLVDYFLKQTDTDVFVVIGHELLPDLPSWKESTRLCALANFLVIQRPGSCAGELPKGLKVTTLHESYQAGILVSSTTLRTLLAQGVSCAGLLPPSVAAFCRERGLYGAKRA